MKDNQLQKDKSSGREDVREISHGRVPAEASVNISGKISALLLRILFFGLVALLAFVACDTYMLTGRWMDEDGSGSFIEIKFNNEYRYHVETDFNRPPDATGEIHKEDDGFFIVYSQLTASGKMAQRTVEFYFSGYPRYLEVRRAGYTER